MADTTLTIRPAMRHFSAIIGMAAATPAAVTAGCMADSAAGTAFTAIVIMAGTTGIIGTGAAVATIHQIEAMVGGDLAAALSVVIKHCENDHFKKRS